jgi:hypothetical protein
MKLEDLRRNDLGTFSAWLPKLGNSPRSMTHLTFPYFATNAFYFSAQQIEQLETTSAIIHQGNAVQNTIGLWFIAIEAYVNSILRISCLLINTPFEAYKNKEFGPRLTALLRFLDIDRAPFYEDSFQRLEEFKRYRNELFHDRTNDKPLKFQKTLFSGNPMYANQIDVMQAAVIALEVFEAFRYTFAGLDLMPQVKVDKGGSFFFSPVDRLYNCVLGPYFEMAIAKHSLSSLINLDIRMSPLDTSHLANKGDVQILVKAIPDGEFNHSASQQQTRFGPTIFDAFKNEVVFDTDNGFQLPTYNRP